MLNPDAFNRLLTEEEVRPIWDAWIRKAIEDELNERLVPPKRIVEPIPITKERRQIDSSLTSRFSGTFQPDPNVSPRFSSPRAIEAQKSPRFSSSEPRKIDTPTPNTTRSNAPRYDTTARTPKSTKLTDSAK